MKCFVVFINDSIQYTFDWFNYGKSWSKYSIKKKEPQQVYAEHHDKE